MKIKPLSQPCVLQDWRKAIDDGNNEKKIITVALYFTFSVNIFISFYHHLIYDSHCYLTSAYYFYSVLFFFVVGV